MKPLAPLGSRPRGVRMDRCHAALARAKGFPSFPLRLSFAASARARVGFESP